MNAHVRTSTLKRQPALMDGDGCLQQQRLAHTNDGLWKMPILSLQDQDGNGGAIASLVSVLCSSCFMYSKYINWGFLMV